MDEDSYGVHLKINGLTCLVLSDTYFQNRSVKRGNDYDPLILLSLGDLFHK